jgi:CP family cyanate transporter-like MFS transporter
MHPSWERRNEFGFVAILFVVGVAVRPPYSGVAPLLPRIQAEFDMPYGVASGLTAIPVLFLGLMAFAGPLVARRYGTGPAVLASLCITLLLSLVRSGAPSGWTLIALTIPLGAAIGLCGALIPATAEHLSARMRGVAMSFYTMGLQLGTGGGAAVAGPLAAMTASWRLPLLVLSLPLLAAAWGWIRVRGLPRDVRVVHSLPIPALGLILVFGIQSAAFHATATWLPAHLQEVGWGESEAGLSLGVLNMAALLGTAAVATWVTSFAERQRVLVVASLVLGAGLLLLGLLPQYAIVWVLVSGAAFGTLFPIAITLPLDQSRDTSSAVALTAGTLGFGYLMASVAGFATGFIRDASGEFTAVFILLALSGPMLAATGLLIRPRRS